MVEMSKEFSISSCHDSIDVITLHILWWPQLHSTYSTNLEDISVYRKYIED